MARAAKTFSGNQGDKVQMAPSASEFLTVFRNCF
jgi:hypothetical protein